MIIACYARKSSCKENDSIIHQLDIMRSYISSKKELSGADILFYTDDGHSGISADRPQFQELLTKVRERLIDVIVVKDLSRLGRNYLDVCKLTDSIFPFMGVRLIAIADNYDSAVKQQTLIDLGTAFKAILDEYYVIETSEKLKSSARARIIEGQFLGSLPYGYNRVDKHTVTIDEPKADIVRSIFEMYIQGKTCSQIAGELNSLHRDEKVWTNIYVGKVLSNECYLGRKVSLTNSRNIKLKRREPIDPDNWYINDNAFPPIIDKQTFDLANQKKVFHKHSYNKERHMMSKKIYCAGCGRVLRHNKYSFSCKSGYLLGREPCFEGYIKKDFLYPIVLYKIKDYINEGMKEYDLRFSFSDKVKLENELEQLRATKAKIFEALVDSRMSEEQFRTENERISFAITEKKKRLECCRKSAALKSKYKSERLIDTLRRLSTASELTREHMMFVERINVFDKDHFEVILQNDSPLTVLCRNMDIFEEEFL